MQDHLFKIQEMQNLIEITATAMTHKIEIFSYCFRSKSISFQRRHWRIIKTPYSWPHCASIPSPQGDTYWPYQHGGYHLSKVWGKAYFIIDLLWPFCLLHNKVDKHRNVADDGIYRAKHCNASIAKITFLQGNVELYKKLVTTTIETEANRLKMSTLGEFRLAFPHCPQIK